MSEKAPLLEIKGLRKEFRQGKEKILAVAGVDLAVYPGEALGLVGESGCGKTTLGQMLVHLIEPTAGQIFLRGEDITRPARKRKRELCRQIQIVFQDPYSSIDPQKTVGWLMEEPLKLHGMGDREARQRTVRETLASVGLDESFQARFPGELSGGQRQRVAIALALVLGPDFLVCDEPVSALDVSVQAQVLNLLLDLKRSRGLTCLFISHDLNVVSYLSDRIAVMYLGSVVELGPAQAVSSRPLHPYTRALFSASMDLMGDRERVALSGDLPSPAHPPGGCPFHTRCPFRKELCERERPPLEEVEPGRWVACHNRASFKIQA